MAYAILGNPKPAFFDSSGSPLVGGTITTQDPTDDSVKASYPTAADADAGTNGTSGDITLDARGEPTSTQYWGKDGEDYKVIIKDSLAATVYTLTNIRLPGHTRRATVTFTSTDATPTVAESDTFITAGTTTITDFDDGQVGDTIKILAASTITVAHGGAVSLYGSVDFNMVAGDTLTLTMFNDQVWEEVARTTQAGFATVSKYKPSDQARSGGTADLMANDTDLVYTIPAAGTYAFELFATLWGSTVGTQGAAFNMNYSGTVGGASQYVAQGYINGTGLAGVSYAVAAAVSTENFIAGDVSTTAYADTVHFVGTLIATTVGDFAFAWAQDILDASNALNFGEGSFLKITRLA